MTNWDSELDKLFRDYRDACSVPEPSPSFMPGVWLKIEARRSFGYRLQVLARGFVAAAAAVVLLMVAALELPFERRQPSPVSYLDALAASHTSENLFYPDRFEMEAGGSGH
jgi:hypothetical protein